MHARRSLLPALLVALACALAACTVGSPPCTPSSGRPAPGGIVGGQARIPVALAQANSQEPFSREQAVTKGEVLLVDAAGRALPGRTLEVGATGGFQINRVPAGQSLVVALRTKTATGATIELKGLAQTNDQGDTTDVNAATTIAVAALLEGHRQALGAFDQDKYDQLVAKIYLLLPTVTRLNLADDAAVIALFKTWASADADLKALYDALRAQITKPTMTLAEQVQALAAAQGLPTSASMPARPGAAPAGSFGSGAGGGGQPLPSSQPATDGTAATPSSVPTAAPTPVPTGAGTPPIPAVTAFPSVPPLTGAVTTIAGSNAGFRDGDGQTAQFREPAGLAFDPLAATPTLYVADAGNNRVRRIILSDPARPTVQTVAGTGASGISDGPGGDAELATPTGLAFDLDGTLLVTCAQGASVRRIDVRRADAAVSTVWAPEGSGKFAAPAGITVDPVSRAVYMADAGDNLVRRMQGSDPSIAPSRFSAFGGGSAPTMLTPTGVVTDPAGFLWVADTGKALIRRVTADGTVSTAAGRVESGGDNGASAQAYNEGRGEAARFFLPMGLARHPRGFLLVVDSGNNRVRQLDSDGATSLLAGSGAPGTADGSGAEASFNRPGWVAVAPDGSAYVTDVANHRVRRIR